MRAGEGATNQATLCNGYIAALDALRDRLRAGYRAIESDHLLNRERELRERVAEHCR